MDSHLTFNVIEEKPKTKVFEVVSKTDGAVLGHIAWHGPWRQYVFEPNISYLTIWSEGCLKELIGFLERLKIERKIEASK